MTYVLKLVIAWAWILASAGLIWLATLGIISAKDGSGLVASWVVALVAPLWATLYTCWPNPDNNASRFRPYLAVPLIVLTFLLFGVAYFHFLGHAYGDRTIPEIIDQTKEIIFFMQGTLIALLTLYLGKD